MTLTIITKGDFNIELDTETNEYSIVDTRKYETKAKSKSLLEIKGALELLLNESNKVLDFQAPTVPDVRVVTLVKKKESSMGSTYWVDSFGNKYYGFLKQFSEEALAEGEKLLEEHEAWMKKWFKFINSLKEFEEVN
jgi:hypothetical protein